MRLFLLSIAMMAGLAANVRAEGSGVAGPAIRCDYSWDAAKYSPDEFRMSGEGSAVKLCTENGTTKPYLFATRPTRGDHGVCYFWVSDLTKPGRTDSERNLMMQRARDPCPRQDDPGYISNLNVPDGVFAELMSQWQNGTLIFPASKSGPEWPDFAALLKTVEGHKRLSVWSIESVNRRPASELSARQAGAITLEIVDTGVQPNRYYVLDVDWLNGAFRVTDVLAIYTGG